MFGFIKSTKQVNKDEFNLFDGMNIIDNSAVSESKTDKEEESQELNKNSLAIDVILENTNP